jgi:hypothetical protein
MTAKETQAHILKVCLKPLLKNSGYRTSNLNWWKEQGDIVVAINLQNFSWNTRDSIDFCFNIGIGFKAIIGNEKPTILNSTITLREGSFIQNRPHEFRDHTGYRLGSHSSTEGFMIELNKDFTQFILPKLESLRTVQDCLIEFGSLDFWGEHLRATLRKYNLIE